MIIKMVPSQFVLKSICTQVNSYSFWSIRTQKIGQFVLIWSIRTHSWSIRTHFGRFVPILVDSYSYLNEYELTKMSTNCPKINFICAVPVLVLVLVLISVGTDQNEYELTKLILVMFSISVSI